MRPLAHSCNVIYTMFGILAQSRHSMIGVELKFSRCADGAEIVEYSAPTPNPKEALLGGDAREGLYIRYRSGVMRLYDRRLVDLKQTMAEEFLACSSPAGFMKFVSDYGIPGGAPDGRTTEVELSALVESRDWLRQLFDLTAANKTTDAVHLYNRIAKPLTPFLAQWSGHKTPVMAFEAQNPYGLMAMEAALAVANATTLRTCAHCSRPFLAGALTSKRTNAFYCQNKCRVAHQRAV